MFPVQQQYRSQGDETQAGSRPFSFSPKHVVVAAGGVEPDPARLLRQLGSIDQVIAADGGLRLTERMGLTCDLLVGDFDTLRASEVEAARGRGTEVRTFPKDKAKSDLELAIDAAVTIEASHISLIGALGGETDHCLTNFLSPLSHCAESQVWGRLLTSSSQVYLTRSPVTIVAQNHRISLVSLSARTERLTLSGFQYPLTNATLSRSKTLGLANKTVSETATIEFETGELFVTIIHPEQE